MYEVIRAFVDTTDHNRIYEVGDLYPATGVTPEKKRITSLLDGTNANGRVYLRERKSGTTTGRKTRVVTAAEE